jgi:hypothetical protein
MVDDPRSGRIALSSAEGVDPEAHGPERTDCVEEEWSGLWRTGRTGPKDRAHGRARPGSDPRHTEL